MYTEEKLHEVRELQSGCSPGWILVWLIELLVPNDALYLLSFIIITVSVESKYFFPVETKPAPSFGLPCLIRTLQKYSAGHANADYGMMLCGENKQNILLYVFFG